MVAGGGGVGSGAAVEEAWTEEAGGEGVVYGLAHVAEVEEVVEGAAAVGWGGHWRVGFISLSVGRLRSVGFVCLVLVLLCFGFCSCRLS